MIWPIALLFVVVLQAAISYQIFQQLKAMARNDVERMKQAKILTDLQIKAIERHQETTRHFVR